MNVMAINGSPRKNWNTATLLKKALEGAQSRGARTELVNLYDLDFKGCTSCFACKRKGGEHGICAMKDDLTDVLVKVKQADALIFGSPIYIGSISSGMRAFLERFLFSNFLYNKEFTTFFPKKIPAGFIYTMGISESMMKSWALKETLQSIENLISHMIGPLEALYSFDAYQFDDYAKYEADRFDEPARKKTHDKQFPLDCQKAYDLGVSFASR